MIPDFQTIMRPALDLLSDGETRRSREMKDLLADNFELTVEERAELLPSGRQHTMDNRVGWALSYLFQSGLTERPSRGQVRITDAGREALRQHPDRIDMRVLEAYPAYLEFKERTRDRPESTGTQVPATPAGELSAATPNDLVDQAVRLNRAAVEGEALSAALALTPLGFERLVIGLLRAMGYGERGSLVQTSATGDGGVDGIISQDPLGLDRIYVQAKRFAPDNPVQRPRIQEFAGALLGQQGDRGVFITTSSFTQGARDEADRINVRIELIDGRRLAQLMVAHGVGVEAESTVTLYRLDEDYFESL